MHLHRLPTRRDMLRGSVAIGIGGLAGCFDIPSADGRNSRNGEQNNSENETEPEGGRDQIEERWMSWTPEPQALSVFRLGVRYWDFSSIRETITTKTEVSLGAIEYESFPGAASPYSFVDLVMENEFLQVTTPDDEILYALITGSFSRSDAQSGLEEADVERVEYEEYRLYQGREYAVGVSDGAIILPSTRNMTVDEQSSLIQTIIDTERGDIGRYYESDADFVALSDGIIDTNTHLQTVHISPLEPGETEFDDVVGYGEIFDNSGEVFTLGYYVLFDHESNVDVETIRTEFEDDDPDTESEYQEFGRIVVVKHTVPVPDDEPLSFIFPASIGFLECEFARPAAQARYGLC